MLIRLLLVGPMNTKELPMNVSFANANTLLTTMCGLAIQKTGL